MDLLFLDIYMKKLNGMETARKLRQIQCKVPIIFLTASPDYAIESYEVQASGYLLKSFSEEKLMKLLNRILLIHLISDNIISKNPHRNFNAEETLTFGGDFSHIHTHFITHTFHTLFNNRSGITADLKQ